MIGLVGRKVGMTRIFKDPRLSTDLYTLHAAACRAGTKHLP